MDEMICICQKETDICKTCGQPKVLRIVTSIKINPELWKQVKIAAIREDLTISEVLEEALQDWLVKK